MVADSTLGMSPGQARGFAAPDGSGMMFPVVRGRPGSSPAKQPAVDTAPSASGALLSYLVRRRVNSSSCSTAPSAAAAAACVGWGGAPR
jgi:hypothetical protein